MSTPVLYFLNNTSLPIVFIRQDGTSYNYASGTSGTMNSLKDSDTYFIYIIKEMATKVNLTAVRAYATSGTLDFMVFTSGDSAVNYCTGTSCSVPPINPTADQIMMSPTSSANAKKGEVLTNVPLSTYTIPKPSSNHRYWIFFLVILIVVIVIAIIVLYKKHKKKVT